MLVLTRRVDEKVVVTVGDEQMEVSIVRIEGKQVRIGFKASSRVIIDRPERFEDAAVEVIE